MGAETVDFTAYSRSLEKVIEVVNCDEQIAIELILNGVLALTAEDFSIRHYQWGEVYDVYGLENYHAKNWYIKFLINEEGILEQLSFHLCEYDLKLASGRVISKSSLKRMDNGFKK